MESWNPTGTLRASGHVGVGVERRMIKKEPGGKLPDNRHVAGKQQKLLELAAMSSSFPFQSSPKESPGMCIASG